MVLGNVLNIVPPRGLCSSGCVLVRKSLKSRNSGGGTHSVVVAGEPTNFHIISERDFMGGVPIGISNWRNFGNSGRELVTSVISGSILMREI